LKGLKTTFKKSANLILMEKTITAEQLDIFVTDGAVRQIQVMQENDYTLKGLSFRIKIGGKGCEGFTYETGFSSLHEGDILIKKDYPLINFELHLLIDPFTAFYTQSFTLDYLLDTQNNDEGFIVKNAADGQHRGKFFKDESRLPPWAKK
jgi:Fe-S cluster assembly iron-binding protein IscA